MKKNKYILLVAASILSISLISSAYAQTARRESIEWASANMVTGLDSSNLPSVLLIGDSHVERYYPVVSNLLKNKFFTSKITTAKSLGDPDFLNQLKGMLGSYRFDVIFFNNGLHGVKYTIEEYARDLPKVYQLLKKHSPHAKLYWVETTARRVNGNLTQFDPYNEGVNDRNRSVHSFATKKGIPVLGFSSLSLEHPDYYAKDGIHFNETGVKTQAQMIAEEALKWR